MLNTIIAPVDGSEGSTKAVRFAGQLAKQTGAELILMYVYDAPTASAMGLARQSREELEHVKEEVAKGSFQAAEAVLEGTPAKRYVTFGHPSHEIVSYAKQVKADLVVMGSRGLSQMEGLLLGSVSDQVVHHAHCAVTIVR
ncbi:MAG: universal stress protein [Myxococcales bacterium]|nr:universal stress protein [Myxococcales bacterium]MCB9578889.1 universal stress protein [Polyangiaceae bacterium]